MIAHLAVAPLATSAVEKEADKDASQKAFLSMAWSVDPSTGKLVARWVGGPTETPWRRSLASAA
jgi:hypothetical protein